MQKNYSTYYTNKENTENLIWNPESPELHVGDFTGPLDLLLYLIEKNKIDLFDLPISELTNQYLDYISNLETVDLNKISDFLVMGAELVRLKSKMMLPDYQDKDNLENDPRDEIVWKLLLYRRCKLIAKDLEKRNKKYTLVFYRKPLSTESLGIKPHKAEDFYADENDFSPTKFCTARTYLAERNQARFQDLSEKIDYIVSRKHLSLKEQIFRLNQALEQEKSVNFNALYDQANSKAEVLTGFLAMLELVNKDMISIHQDYAFADIIIEKNSAQKIKWEDLLSDLEVVNAAAGKSGEDNS